MFKLSFSTPFLGLQTVYRFIFRKLIITLKKLICFLEELNFMLTFSEDNKLEP